MLGWSDADLKLGIESFDTPEFESGSKLEDISKQFSMDDLSLSAGGGLTKFDLEVCFSYHVLFVLVCYSRPHMGAL